MVKSLKAKLLLSFGLVATAVGVVGFIGAHALDRTNEEFQYAADDLAPSLDRVGALRSDVLRVQGATIRAAAAVLAGDAGRFDEARAARAAWSPTSARRFATTSPRHRLRRKRRPGRSFEPKNSSFVPRATRCGASSTGRTRRKSGGRSTRSKTSRLVTSCSGRSKR